MHTDRYDSLNNLVEGLRLSFRSRSAKERVSGNKEGDTAATGDTATTLHSSQVVTADQTWNLQLKEPRILTSNGADNKLSRRDQWRRAEPPHKELSNSSKGLHYNSHNRRRPQRRLHHNNSYTSNRCKKGAATTREKIRSP
jgi:hypothetical protein